MDVKSKEIEECKEEVREPTSCWTARLAAKGDTSVHCASKQEKQLKEKEVDLSI